MSRGGRTPEEVAANLGDYVIYNEKSATRTLDALIRQSFEAPGIKVRKEDLEKVFCTVASLFASVISEDLLFDTLLEYNDANNECLETLIDLRLITRDPRQRIYTMHDLVYTYAALNASREIQERGFVACQEYIKEYAHYYDAIYQVTYNLLGMIQAHATRPDLVGTQALLDVLYSLVEQSYFDARGYRPEFVHALVEVARFADAEGEFRKAHYLWAKAGNGYTEYLLDYDKAISAYEEAARLAARAQAVRQEKHPGEAQYRHALSLSLVGKAYVKKQDAVKAKEYLAKAVSVAEHPYNPEAVSQIYEHGVFLAGEGLNDIELARDYARLSLEHTEHIGNDDLKQERRFFITINLGQIEREEAQAAREANDLPLVNQKLLEALEHYAKAEQIAAQQDNDDWKARVAQECGEVLFEQGNADAAVKQFSKAAVLYSKINSPDLENLQNLILWFTIYELLIRSAAN
jgi:tetratricopeptide (TPR) repeat protein